MIDIWDERPLIYIEDSEDADKLDAWLEKLKGYFEKRYKDSYQRGVINQILFMEAEIKPIKEKAEKWDRFAAEYYEHKWIQDYDNLKDKLEAVKKHVRSLPVPSSQWWRDLVRHLWDREEAEKILEDS